MKTTALYLGMCFLLLATWFAMAQVTSRKAPQTVSGYLVVAACGTLPAPAYVAGTYAAPTIDPTGKICTSQ